MQYGAQHPTTKSQLKENVVKNRYRTTLPCKYYDCYFLMV